MFHPFHICTVYVRVNVGYGTQIHSVNDQNNIKKNLDQNFIFPDDKLILLDAL
jgi:hypothetical protein